MNTPMRDTVPSGSSGRRHTALARVDADVHDVLRLVEHQPVRARNVVGDDFEPPVRAQPVDRAGRILQPGLALVGEIKIAVGGEDEIVQPLEVLEVVALDERRDGAALCIEQHQAALVVGDEDAAVLVDLQAVGFAVVLDDEFPLGPGRDAEDAAVRNVGAIKIAVAIERRAFEKTAARRRAAPGRHALGRRIGAPEFLRQFGEDIGGYELRRGKQIHKHSLYQ